MNPSFLIGLLTLLFLCGCKRYEDDHRRYLKTPCGRIAKKWELTSIAWLNGREFMDSVIYYKTPDNGWAVVPSQSFTYRGLVLQLGRSANKLCLETGIRGDATVTNKPFSYGSYELINKRTLLRFDVRPAYNGDARYFYGIYAIHKMTKDELNISNSWIRISFRSVD